jgi:hypothetical protein
MRPLSTREIDQLLTAAVPARFASIDGDGFPHVTPLWFLWDSGSLWATSRAGAPHLGRLAANPRAGVVIDVEEDERPDGERPNRQLRLVGTVRLSADHDGFITRRITEKYVLSPGQATMLERRCSVPRTAIQLLRHLTVGLSSL